MWKPVTWLACVAISCTIISAAIVSPGGKYSSALLGQKECLDGPGYWCQNFTAARNCNATKHCFDAVWMKQVLPPDNGEICDTCKKMVAQARDELRANETQENIKLVLEGSCMILIPIKPLARECAKLVDDAIPELIEALSSEMDPQVVCSTAGLCNSPRMDQLFAHYKSMSKVEHKLTCSNCQAVAGMIDANFRASSRDDVLNSLLEICGNTGSFSDGCSATMIVNFNNVYEGIAANLNADGVCHLAGVCSQKYHNHDTEVAVVEVPKLEGDMPCELCEQLVQHLRDVLVANTTEKEFEQVLLGICGQTKGFKTECVDLVETYYPVVYGFLTTELDGKVLCTEIGICPRSSSEVHPLYPLLPVAVADSLSKSSNGLHRVPLTQAGVSVHSGQHSLQGSEALPLPLETLILTPGGDEQLCKFCEFFLHFLQQEVTDPTNEQAVQEAGEKACQTLPKSYAPMCKTFVDTYTKAMLALLAQDIDPSQVCPKIGVCPGYPKNLDVCEPCKNTANILVNGVAGNASEENIKNVLMTMCLSLPFEDSRHCSNILIKHHEDLTDMIIAEFTTDEMCIFMQYCHVTPSALAVDPIGDTETNEIHQSTAVEVEGKADLCVLCEFVMKTIEKDLQDKKTEEEIREAVEHVCLVMPRTIRPKCKQFVDQYTDLIVTLLAQSVSPDQICQMMSLCVSRTLTLDYARNSLGKCIVCETLMGALQGVVEDRSVQRDFNRQLEIACLKLPLSMRRECQDIVRQMAPQIEMILQEVPIGTLVCNRLKLCGATQTVDMVGADRCHEGQAYWCLSTMHAAICQKIEHCQQNVWLSNKPNRKNLRAKTFIF